MSFIYRRTANYYETDQMGVVHHSNHIRYFEEARIAFMKSIGCVAAQNLDGGGSTGIMLGNQHLNTWDQGKGTSRKKEYRAVRTALGFFKRR